MLTEVLILEPKQKSLRLKEGRRLLQWQGPSPTLRLIHNRKGVSELLTRSFNKYLVSYTCSLNRNDYKQPAQARISKTWLCSFQTKTGNQQEKNERCWVWLMFAWGTGLGIPENPTDKDGSVKVGKHWSSAPPSLWSMPLLMSKGVRTLSQKQRAPTKEM